MERGCFHPKSPLSFFLIAETRLHILLLYKKYLLPCSTATEQEALSYHPYVCSSGMRILHRKPIKAFRPSDNSPFIRHYNHRSNAQNPTLPNILLLCKSLPGRQKNRQSEHDAQTVGLQGYTSCGSFHFRQSYSEIILSDIMQIVNHPCLIYFYVVK